MVSYNKMRYISRFFGQHICCKEIGTKQLRKYCFQKLTLSKTVKILSMITNTWYLKQMQRHNKAVFTCFGGNMFWVQYQCPLGMVSGIRWYSGEKGWKRSKNPSLEERLLFIDYQINVESHDNAFSFLIKQYCYDLIFVAHVIKQTCTQCRQYV